MTGTDHYAEAVRLLASVDPRDTETEDGFSVRNILIAAQVHVGLASLDEQRRMAGVMQAADESSRDLAAVLQGMKDEDELAAPADSPGYLSIPWPPSDELVERVVLDVCDVLSAGDETYRDIAYATARAVLDAIGGAGDE